MDISSIQSGSSSYDLFTSRKKSSYSAADVFYGGNTGPDTVSISDQAQEMAKLAQSNQGEEDNDSSDNSQTYLKKLQNGPEAKSGKASLKGKGADFMGIMLESLFMADLEENESSKQSADDASAEDGTASANTANSNAPAKKNSLISDSGKATEIKKAMQDITSGKIDISDLPKVMSVKSGGNVSSNTQSAASAQNTDSKNNDNKIKI